MTAAEPSEPPAPPAVSAASAGDRVAVLQFIERFAVMLNQAGIPRTPARVFVALFASDAGRLTAAELAEQLRISPAAVSGAVRYLIQVDLVLRERETGSRRDHYRVPDNIWMDMVSQRDQVFGRWAAALQDGVEILGADTPAGQRAQLSVTFFEFMQKEVPELRERWRDYVAGVDGSRRERRESAPDPA